MASAGGKLVLATVGGSPTQASEVALLAVDSADQLLSTQPSQWQTLRKDSTVEVRPHVFTSRTCRHSSISYPTPTDPTTHESTPPTPRLTPKLPSFPPTNKPRCLKTQKPVSDSALWKYFYTGKPSEQYWRAARL